MFDRQQIRHLKHALLDARAQLNMARQRYEDAIAGYEFADARAMKPEIEAAAERVRELETALAGVERAGKA